MCMDYLLAAVDYFEFVSMMLDAKVSVFRLDFRWVSDFGCVGDVRLAAGRR